MRRLLFNGQRQWGTSSVPQIIWENYAQATGADVGKWRSCMDSRQHQSNIEADRKLGLSLGVEATPTIFIGDQKIVGAVPFSVLANAVQAQLRS